MRIQIQFKSSRKSSSVILSKAKYPESQNTGFFTTRVQNDREENAKSGFFGTSSLRMTGEGELQRIDPSHSFRMTGKELITQNSELTTHDSYSGLATSTSELLNPAPNWCWVNFGTFKQNLERSLIWRNTN